ncbi:hypothetical protein G4G27_13770 [Sphingomonas sp. So64.6b]|uniref:hypothetical protein n=1 Tax=Sphingomonas sp. So64.6b TaxID=2997354 RepID=UPI001600C3D0|nr:hypothetical protein [Sphingomonas sp. So64.6b]QNA84944.1 hypothetical protein G4G27_13770 [Sphingomonas sp. So64.6b]
MSDRQSLPTLLCGLAVLCMFGSAAAAKTDLIEPFRELQIDPATLTLESKLYHQGDVVVRASLRRPATTRIEEDRRIDLNGFTLTIPKDTLLTERSFVRAPKSRLLSDAGRFGMPSTGILFCNADRLALGPFSSGDNLKPFKGLACLIDDNRDGKFEAVTFIGFFSAREVGPVSLSPLAYEAMPGAMVPDHIDMIFQRFSGNYLYLKPVLYGKDGKQGSIRMYTDERVSALTDYADGCLINAPSDATTPSTILGTILTVKDADAVAQSFRATIAAQAFAKPLTAQVSGHQLISDWIPETLSRCGDKQRR